MKKVLIMLFVMTVFQAQAQRAVDDFTLTNVVNGAEVSLSKYPSCSGIILIFTSNNCPYDEYYRARIQKISKEYSDKVPVLLINSLIDANETPELMAKKAQQAGITVPYLADKDQVVLLKVGATKTPHAVLLKNNGGKFTVFYNGAFDDNAQVEADVHQSYLHDAVEALVANKAAASAEVRPVGCTIRRK